MNNRHSGADASASPLYILKGSQPANNQHILPSIKGRSALIQMLALLVGGLIAIFLAGDSPAQMTVSLTLLYMGYAAAWNIVAGFAGQFTFGHSAFFGLGAYAATLMSQKYGVPPLYGMWVGVALAAIVAAVIGAMTLKLRGLYFGLVTVVFPTVFSVFATYMGLQEVSVPFSPDAGIASFMPSNPRVISLFALAAVLLICGITIWLVRSRFGLFFIALRSDQDAAEASGVRTTRVKIYALVISAALSAVIGAIFASVSLVVTPNDAFGLQMSVQPVLFTVFGGIGTLAGPLIGALILVPLSETLTATFGATLPNLSGMVYGLALLLVITFFPSGLAPVLTSLARRAWPRSAAASLTDDAPDSIIESIESKALDADERCEAFAAGSEAAVLAGRGGKPILELAGIAKAFGGTKVLQDVTMHVAPGEIVGIIGPNGAGKTTLFNIINGFLRADTGTIKMSGDDITTSKASEIAGHGLGRTFQTVRLFSGMSTIENVLTAALRRHPLHAEAARVAWRALDEVGLSARAYALVGELTTGELRRLELARAMSTAGEGGLLLLDEFLGGLTKADSAVLLAALKRWRARGGSVLAIEHTMRAMADFVDRFVVLNFGVVIASGEPDEILKNRDVIKAYLGDKWGA